VVEVVEQLLMQMVMEAVVVVLVVTCIHRQFLYQTLLMQL
jgi:hypothetical protein